MTTLKHIWGLEESGKLAEAERELDEWLLAEAAPTSGAELADALHTSARIRLNVGDPRRALERYVAAERVVRDSVDAEDAERMLPAMLLGQAQSHHALLDFENAFDTYNKMIRYRGATRSELDYFIARAVTGIVLLAHDTERDVVDPAQWAITWLDRAIPAYAEADEKTRMGLHIDAAVMHSVNACGLWWRDDSSGLCEHVDNALFHVGRVLNSGRSVERLDWLALSDPQWCMSWMLEAAIALSGAASDHPDISERLRSRRDRVVRLFEPEEQLRDLRIKLLDAASRCRRDRARGVAPSEVQRFLCSFLDSSAGPTCRVGADGEVATWVELWRRVVDAERAALGSSDALAWAPRFAKSSLGSDWSAG